MCQGIASGMGHLSKLKIIHNDLAARNILVQEMKTEYDMNGGFMTNVKITDFGLASAKRSLQSGGGEGAKALPIRWTAPEILEDRENKLNELNLKSDVWSFGVVMYEIFTYCRNVPYSGIPTSKILSLIKKGERLEQPSECPTWMYNLMMKCMRYTPSERPTFEEIFQIIGDRRKTEPSTSGVLTQKLIIDDIPETPTIQYETQQYVDYN
eukprot:TRINITY_DN941_c0_g2_i1.p1 TRINITY_DN941_c0_g2~~TRINITY_DN941_c0_g2_i1.p1  ORF type:complete len:244 (-),score=82.07 TRINITY_DN941_c0_g2_i1:127-756(-)